MKYIYISKLHTKTTTVQYFEKAFNSSKSEICVFENGDDILTLNTEDIFIYFDPSLIVPINLEKAKCLTAAYFIDVHQGLEQRLRLALLFDVVFIAQREYIDYFIQAGCLNVHWLPLACDPEVHYKPTTYKTLDVSFVGKLGKKGSWRHAILKSVLKHFKTNDFTLFVDPQTMGELYSSSKIVFNASIKNELNMRFFEAMAAGALLVTDRIPNAIDSLFEEGKHYIGYSDSAEAIEKIKYFLESDMEREQIARCGQKLVFEKHTYNHRLNSLLASLKNANLQAPARFFNKKQLSELYSKIFIDIREPWRFVDLITHYGFNYTVFKNAIISIARFINSKIPLTPNAIKNKIFS